MLRFLAVVFSVAALIIFVGSGDALAQKAQMVKAPSSPSIPPRTSWSSNQKVKNEVVDRELSILDTTEFVIMNAGQKKRADRPERPGGAPKRLRAASARLSRSSATRTSTSSR